MKLTKLAAIALAALTVTAGAAIAAPGNAPDGVTDDHADAHENDAGTEMDASKEAENGSADAGMNASETDESGSAAAADTGPPEEMPGNVPDHVQAIHELIRKHVSGMLDGALGPAVSDATPDDGDEQFDDGTAVNGTASTPTPEPTEAA